MAIQDINIGAIPNDGTGDGVRTAFGKVNSNFDEVDSRLTTAQGDADAAQADATQALADAAAARATADAAIPATEKGAANGVGTLNASGTQSVGERPAAGLWLPGTSGNYASTPDSAALDITGEMDIRAFVKPATWHVGSGNRTLVSHYGGSLGAQRWYYQLLPSGALFLGIRMTDDTLPNATSTAVIPEGSGALWCRVTWRASDGRCQFFTSPDGTTWTQLGTDRTFGAGLTPKTVTGARLEIGTRSVDSTDRMPGAIYRAQVYDGIDGTLVADFDSTSPPSRHGIHPSSFTDSVGNVWTINGTEWEYRDDLGNTLATASEAAASTPGVAGGVATLDANGRVVEPHAITGVLANFYVGAPGTIGGGAAMSEATMQAVPLDLPGPLPIQSISLEVTSAGSAGAVIRLGAYLATDSGGGSLLFDAGTVDATTTGVKTISVTQTLPRGRILLVAACQGAAATRPSIRILSSMPPLYPTSGVRTAVAGSAWGAAGGVPGALPSTGFWSGGISIPYIVVRKAA